MYLSQAQWEKMIRRWAQVPTPMIGEVKMICAIIAGGISDECERIKNKRVSKKLAFTDGFFRGGFQNYCTAIGIHPDFLFQKIRDSLAHEQQE